MDEVAGGRRRSWCGLSRLYIKALLGINLVDEIDNSEYDKINYL